MTTTPDTPPTGRVTETADTDSSVPGLIRQLAHEVPSLLNKEMALVKAELRESAQHLKQGAFAVGAGAIVVLAGLVITLLAGVYVLSHVLAPWLAALLVGVAAMVIGFFMIQAGKKSLEPASLTPERTASALQKDKDAIRRKTS